MKKLGLGCLTAVAVVGALTRANAQVPTDFPPINIVSNSVPDPGYLFGSLSVSNIFGHWSNYFAILDNAGGPVLLNKTNSLGLLGGNGLFVAAKGPKGSPLGIFPRIHRST